MGGSGLCLVVTFASCVVVASCGDSGRESRLPEIPDRGGPHMAHPQLVPIFFADDTGATTMTQFSQWIVTSTWIETVGAEYGVGDGSVLGVVHRPEPAPDAVTDTQLVDLLYQGLADGTLPRPATGGLGDVLYMVHLPSHTVVTAGSSESCVDFGGYHDSARRRGVELAYAVIATCPGFIANVAEIETRELVSSHELIEAATDPFPSNNPGFQLRDPTSPWLALGGEVADLCIRGDETAIVREAGFVAQRSWSNVAATAGDPCVPVPGTGPYFNVIPAITTVPRIPPGGHQSIVLGGWDTSEIDGFAWRLSAFPARPGEVALALGVDALSARTTTTLDVGVPATTMLGTFLRFYVYSDTSTSYQVFPMFAIAGDPCSSFTGCEACTSHYGCGFCATTGKCEAEGRSGSTGSCPASSFATWPGSCDGFCTGHSGSCADCASQPGCGWCASGGAPRCLEASHGYSHPEDNSCPYADWSFTPSYCSP